MTQCKIHNQRLCTLVSDGGSISTPPALVQARREGEKGESFPGPRDVWGAPPSLKNTENGVPDGFFSDLKYA